MSKDVLLPDNLTDEEYAAAFLREFGADIGKPVIYQIKYYVIDKRLFMNKRAQTWKADKKGRGKFMALRGKSVERSGRSLVALGKRTDNGQTRFKTPLH